MTYQTRIAAAVLTFVLSPPRAAAAPSPTVVIDAGHGGSNSGAPSRIPGVYEKRVTLAIARALEHELRMEGVNVVMTRRRDQYLTLRERARRANGAKADAFISLHTNASGAHSHRGVETYVLARDAADVEARRAAAHYTADIDSMLAELRMLEAQHGGIL